MAGGAVTVASAGGSLSGLLLRVPASISATLAAAFSSRANRSAARRSRRSRRRFSFATGSLSASLASSASVALTSATSSSSLPPLRNEEAPADARTLGEQPVQQLAMLNAELAECAVIHPDLAAQPAIRIVALAQPCQQPRRVVGANQAVKAHCAKLNLPPLRLRHARCSCPPLPLRFSLLRQLAKQTVHGHPLPQPTESVLTSNQLTGLLSTKMAAIAAVTSIKSHALRNAPDVLAPRLEVIFG
jgi:hypothetical protein